MTLPPITALSTMESPVPPHETWGQLDTSKVMEYMRCPRSFFYRYILGWRTEGRYNDLEFGQAIHDALEHILLNLPPSPDVIREAYDNHFLPTYRRVWGPGTDPLFHPKTPEMALKLLIKYCIHYRRDAYDLEVLMTEIGGSVPISSEDSLTFRMDTICRDRSGKVFSLEHKTKGGPFNRMWDDQWTLSPQVGTYTHVLYSLFHPDTVKGVMINGISITKAKEPTISFKRVSCWRTPRAMQQWLSNILEWVASIKRDFLLLSESTEGQDTLLAFKQNPTSCTSFMGCTYSDFCATWSNPLRNWDPPPEGIRVEFWNPLSLPTKHLVSKGIVIT